MTTTSCLFFFLKQFLSINDDQSRNPIQKLTRKCIHGPGSPFKLKIMKFFTLIRILIPNSNQITLFKAFGSLLRFCLISTHTYMTFILSFTSLVFQYLLLLLHLLLWWNLSLFLSLCWCLLLLILFVLPALHSILPDRVPRLIIVFFKTNARQDSFKYINIKLICTSTIPNISIKISFTVARDIPLSNVDTLLMCLA